MFDMEPIQKQWTGFTKSVMKHKLAYAVATLAFILLLLVFIPALEGLQIVYSTGFEGPSASFSSISGLNPAAASTAVTGSGSFNWVNSADGTTWSTNYQIGGTSIDITPTDSTGNIHSQLIGEMGGIGFSNGAATTPEKTYDWNATNPVNGDTQIYEMAMYPLTWTLNFATSTRNFEHLFYYTDNLVNMQIDLNQNMWYFSTAPSNVYFGIADIELTNFTVVSTQSNVKTAMIPSAQYALLSITSPTNGETAAQAFYSYEGAALNPTLFAPSVSTSVTISDLAPVSVRNINGVFSGQDASVHMVFQVDTLVVGEWTVLPTFHGTGGTITPQTSKPPGSIFGGFFSQLESLLANNPLADLVILVVIAGVAVIVAVAFFPELTRAASKAGAKAINNSSKSRSKGKGR
jgi:hypothetical protein